MQDRDLVAAIVAGDPAALAATYDRYASALYAYCRTMLRDPEDAADAMQDTFVVAARKLAGLRDPDRLRPWLYAVARNECLRRARRRQEQATVDLGQAGEVSDDAVDVDAGLHEADVRSLIWAAIQGLNPSEREVFELNVRHELEGADLAAALGVSPNHAHALLSRARGQLEKSLGALLVARTGREDCAELAAILTAWDGELTALLRKRINRHVEQCDVCRERKHRELRPEALLGALPILLLPPNLRLTALRLAGNIKALPPDASSDPPDPSDSPSGNTAPNASMADAMAMTAVANTAGYCAHVAERAEPFDRAGFPVPLDRRSRPLAAARNRSLVAALLLLLILLGIGSYTALRLTFPNNTAAALAAPSPTSTIAAVAVETRSQPPTLIQVSTPPLSPSPSKSPSASPSPSPSLSPGPSVIAITSTPANPSPRHSPSPSPSRSASPLPPPPPPPGTLVVNPALVVAPLSGNNFVGTFTLSAQNGAVKSFAIAVPTPLLSWGNPTVSQSSGGPLASGKSVTITVTLATYPRNLPVVLTVEPPAPQAPISVTVSPSLPIIP